MNFETEGEKAAFFFLFHSVTCLTPAGSNADRENAGKGIKQEERLVCAAVTPAGLYPSVLLVALIPPQIPCRRVP